MDAQQKISQILKAIEIDEEKIQNAVIKLNKIENALNSKFYNEKNVNAHFIGSFSRKTLIDSNNINILYELPTKFLENDLSSKEIFELIDEALKKDFNMIYSEKSKFFNIKCKNNITFKMLPAFLNADGTYTYRVSANSDLWTITNIAEEIIVYNKFVNMYHYFPLKIAKLLRLWKNKQELDINGYLIDTWVYHFFNCYSVKEIINLPYKQILTMFFNYLKNQDKNKYFWLSPGLEHYVVKTDDFLENAEKAHEILQKNNGFEIIEELFDISTIATK